MHFGLKLSTTRYKAWLDDVVNGDEPYGVSELALSGFLRIVTTPIHWFPICT